MSFPEFTFSDNDPPSVVEDVGGGGQLVWSGSGDYCEALEFSERDRVELLNDATTRGPDGRRYRLYTIENYGTEGTPRDVVELLPFAREDLFVTVLYLPALDLDLVGTETPEVYYQDIKGLGEEWLALDALIVLKGKTDDQTALWERRKAEVGAQLLALAGAKDAAQPKRIRQVHHRTGAARAADRRYPWLRRP